MQFTPVPGCIVPLNVVAITKHETAANLSQPAYDAPIRQAVHPVAPKNIKENV